MGAPEGNQYWKLRKDFDSEANRKMSPDTLYEKAQEYIAYCITNPLESVDFRGKDITEVIIPKMRAMTISGCCLFVGISETTWGVWRKDKKYSAVITQVETCIRTQKFEGAAAGLLNPNIIARDLGLVDKQEVETKTKLTPEERKKRIQELIAKGVISQDQVDESPEEDHSDIM